MTKNDRGTLADYGLPLEDTVLVLEDLTERQMDIVRQVSIHSPRWLGAMRSPATVSLVGAHLRLQEREQQLSGK